MRGFVLGLALAMLLALGGGEPRAAETIEQLKEKALQEKPRMKPPYPAPLVLTSVGQGPGASLAKALLTKKARLPLEFRPLLQAEQLPAMGTLLVAVGASAEGLKTAGTNKGREVGRAEALLSAAQKAHLPVILMHLGGAERRDELSSVFIDKALPYADFLIVKREGNEDGYFTRKAQELQTPLKEIEYYQDLIKAVPRLFSAE